MCRLASGRLFFAGDFNEKEGGHPASITEKGCYVALSEDDGESWTIKKLPGAQKHEDEEYVVTLGYSVARQGPDGIINLVTSMNKPCLHFQMNEAWILEKDSKESTMSDWRLDDPGESPFQKLRSIKRKYPNGKIRSVLAAGPLNNGQFLLDGREIWYYEDGAIQREANYKLGRKVGSEIYFSKDGMILSQWEHNDDGSNVWTQYWPNGIKKGRVNLEEF